MSRFLWFTVYSYVPAGIPQTIFHFPGSSTTFVSIHAGISMQVYCPNITENCVLTWKAVALALNNPE